MRGLRHDLEAIANPDWHFLAGAYVAAAADPRAGSRRWSIAGLGVLRDPETMPTLIPRSAWPPSLEAILETR